MTKTATPKCVYHETHDRLWVTKKISADVKINYNISRSRTSITATGINEEIFKKYAKAVKHIMEGNLMFKAQCEEVMKVWDAI
jgi:hypothetical protein